MCDEWFRRAIVTGQMRPGQQVLSTRSLAAELNVDNHPDAAVSGIAAAIGEPARAQMLYYLMDGHARTSTELAVVAGVSPSTASVHVNRLKTAHLVKVLVQGKHRF